MLVGAFDEQALATAGMAASPNTRRAGATAYRVFAEVLRVRYGEASGGKVTIASVAAWRVSAVRRLAATLGADPLVQQVPARTSSVTSRVRCPASNSRGCCTSLVGAPS